MLASFRMEIYKYVSKLKKYKYFDIFFWKLWQEKLEMYMTGYFKTLNRNMRKNVKSHPVGQFSPRTLGKQVHTQPHRVNNGPWHLFQHKQLQEGREDSRPALWQWQLCPSCGIVII